MNMPLIPPRMTRDEFFAWADTYAEDGKYEFDDVRPVAKTGGTLNHGRIQRNVLVALISRLGSDCEALGSGAGVATVGGAVRYPDALVTCTKGPGTDRLVPGVVVAFEVLSPNSGRNDRIDKLREYRAVPSILCYIILEYAIAGLTVLRRASETEEWTATALLAENILQLPEVGIQVPVAEFYAGVDLPDLGPEA